MEVNTGEGDRISPSEELARGILDGLNSIDRSFEA
jgi:hypothetical protein